MRYRRSGRARPLLPLALAVVGVGAALPAGAREGAPVVGVRVERYLAVTVIVRSDAAPTVGDAHGFERRIDPAGRVLSETATPHHDDEPLPALGEFGCAAEGDAAGFVDHTARRPVRLDVDLTGGGTRSALHLYTLPVTGAVGQRPRLQVLICSAGGARPAGGWRLLQAGIGAAFDSPDTHKIGMVWPRGTAPAVTEVAFVFGADPQVGATGRIAQRPGGKLEGSLIGPFDSDFNDNFTNAVAGWWQDPCLDDRPVCLPVDGSGAFQGSIAGGLWEFFADQIPAAGLRFRLAGFTTLSCLSEADCTVAPAKETTFGGPDPLSS